MMVTVAQLYLRMVVLTAMYAAQPALRVFALESTSRPLMPKSHNLIRPRSSRRILDGFTSVTGNNDQQHSQLHTTSSLLFVDN